MRHPIAHKTHSCDLQLPATPYTQKIPQFSKSEPPAPTLQRFEPAQGTSQSHTIASCSIHAPNKTHQAQSLIGNFWKSFYLLSGERERENGGMVGDMPFLMSRDIYLPLIAVSPQHLSPAPYETGKPAITGPSHRLSTQPFTTGHSVPSPAMVELQGGYCKLYPKPQKSLQIVRAAILCEITPHPSI